MSAKVENLDVAEMKGLGPMDRQDELAWLCTAILTHLDMDVRLSSRALDLLKEIHEHDAAQLDLINVASRLSHPNEFGITELCDSEAERIVHFATSRVAN